MIQYVIVHLSCIRNQKFEDGTVEARVVQEIERIMAQETHYLVPNHYEVPSGLKKEADVLVCGAWATRSNMGWCVDWELNLLQQEGYKARIHPDGTLFRD